MIMVSATARMSCSCLQIFTGDERRLKKIQGTAATLELQTTRDVDEFGATMRQLDDFIWCREPLTSLDPYWIYAT
jgi:hypothetical protein